jgi:hypothetical protein
MSMRIDKSWCNNKTGCIDDPASGNFLFSDKADAIALYADIKDFRSRVAPVNNIAFLYQIVDQPYLNQERENESPEARNFFYELMNFRASAVLLRAT